MKIAVIAHDGTKDRLRRFIQSKMDLISNLTIVCTRVISKIFKELILDIIAVESGPLGGDAQIAAQIVSNKIEAVLFLRNPLGKHPQEPDINMLLRLCDVYKVPLATNFKTAEILLNHFKNI